MTHQRTCERPACGFQFENETQLSVHLHTYRQCRDWYTGHFIDWPEGSLTEEPGGDEFNTLSQALADYPGTSGRSLADELFTREPRVFSEPVPWTVPGAVEGTGNSRDVEDEANLFDRPADGSGPLSFLDELVEVTDRVASLSEEEMEWSDSDDDGVGEFEGGEDLWATSPIIDKFLGSAREYGKGRHTLEELDTMDMYPKERAECVYYPFKNEEDFELGAWLLESGVSMSRIDSLLKRPSVRSQVLLIQPSH